MVLVATIAVLRVQREGGHDSASTHAGKVQLPRAMSAEVVFLGIATRYSLHLPLRSSLTLLDAAVLLSIFVWYAIRLAKEPADEPDLIGTAKWVGELHAGRRKTVYIGMFVVAALVILASAEHFAESRAHLRASGNCRWSGLACWVWHHWSSPAAAAVARARRGRRWSRWSRWSR